MTSVSDQRTIASSGDADRRAREVEAQLTDDERFSLVISIFGHVPGSATGGRDPRLPEGLANMSAGYTPGVPRLGITNTGDRAGADVPQLYLIAAADEPRRRLLGFERVELAPGESRQVALTADPRLLARFDGTTDQWHLAAGPYRVALGRSAEDLVLHADAPLDERRFGP